MKEGMHPTLHQVKITCVCGHVIDTYSTMDHNFHVEICSQCHPFFTGKQKLIDTAGRVERFQKRYAKFSEKKPAATKTAPAKQ
ncbi:MAG: 50S ribosomal protein L31 [Deltaproteobacteria bacterium]|nr:50S ribosomal protein L31 [Deltaproteobacteria bacterium]